MSSESIESAKGSAPKLTEARRKIIDTYARVGSYVSTAEICNTHADHARRVVREHPDYHQLRVEEQREEDRAWERAQRDEARARQTADIAWVNADAVKMRARLDQLVEDDDPRVSLAALKLKKSWAEERASSTSHSDDDRVRRVLDALAGPVQSDPTEP